MIFDTIRDLYIYYFYLFSLVLIISALTLTHIVKKKKFFSLFQFWMHCFLKGKIKRSEFCKTEFTNLYIVHVGNSFYVYSLNIFSIFPLFPELLAAWRVIHHLSPSVASSCQKFKIKPEKRISPPPSPFVDNFPQQNMLNNVARQYTSFK